MKQTIVNVSTGETNIVDLTPEEQTAHTAMMEEAAWRSLREMRNGFLADCDWTVATDSPMDVPAWLIYRQALRDLPANTTDPTAPDWPTPPA